MFGNDKENGFFADGEKLDLHSSTGNDFADVTFLDDDMATIFLVDSNLQRENILSSEKAYAYRLKLESMKHRGKKIETTCAQIGHKLKSKDVLAQQVGESRNQIQRYIRLTELIDPLLDMADDKKLPLNSLRLNCHT